MITERINYLKNSLSEKTPDMDKISEILELDYKNIEREEIFRKSAYLKAFSEKIPVVIDENELICGSMRFWKGKTAIRHLNKGHIIVDYRMILRLGLPGIKEKLSMLKTKDSTAFSESVDALCHFILRYANEAKSKGMDEVSKNCFNILNKKPESLWEALQLVWFVHLFLHAEGMSAAVSFGRFDDYLYPFYEQDIKNGVLTYDSAKELIECFFIKTNEGDESQALTLGGDIENELTFLCLEAAGELKLKQPSVCIRTNENTSCRLWDNIISFIKLKLGMPAIFNDKTIIKALINAGIKENDAKNYAIVGCYEANPDGKAYGLTAAGGAFHLFGVLLDFLKENRKFSDFDEFYASFKQYFKDTYNTKILDGFHASWANIQKYCVSPFQSACMSGCLESGIAAEHGGGEYTMFGINILGIGTLTDSIYVIKKLIFEEKRYDYSEFTDQVINNFPDKDLQLLCRNLPGKYGTNNQETDALAEDLSGFIADLVKNGKIADGVIPYAGLFMFTQDIYSANYPATPDGRCNGERVSYGISASDIAKGKTVTSILNSASHIKNDEFADGNPLMFSISEKEVSGERGDELLKSLIKGYFKNGGFHVQINVTDSKTLKEAQKNPEAYDDLIVRISGFSEYFNKIDKVIQDVLIERS